MYNVTSVLRRVLAAETRCVSSGTRARSEAPRKTNQKTSFLIASESAKRSRLFADTRARSEVSVRTQRFTPLDRVKKTSGNVNTS